MYDAALGKADEVLDAHSDAVAARCGSVFDRCTKGKASGLCKGLLDGIDKMLENAKKARAVPR